MGVCCGNNNNKKIRSRNNSTKKNNKLKKADTNSSNNLKVTDINEKELILKRGIIHEIKDLINNLEDNINDYIFGQNKTLLIEACIVCPNCDVIDLIMEKGANIDCEEYQTGNTPIFFCALDLKVDFVQKLLKYHPNIYHKNHSQQNIFEFLKFQLFDQRKSINREMTKIEKEKYEQIDNMLKKYSIE